ncbi:hypothetical protein DEI81_08340 [Curtobacterium sp. MCBD17_013]|uniref:AAA family ATPase n=1 Tax=Curtobacterium sp. MCBD17_013 TaxID=2175668 RepID=UPI000DA95676|nr:AAA family ATPase [Curtobacterium sp. MCBD17_013]PZF62957.1 hypothetical protein DEI81_08340 [Curtobacterium sp. MCBD17_013]
MFFGKRRASQVFTPGELPLERSNVYVSRRASEELLTRGVERNWCPVVYGDYGVGKSTLVRRYFRHEESANWFERTFRGKPRRGRLVYFASTNGLTMPKVFATILEHLQYRVETEVTTSSSVDSGLSFERSKLTANLTAKRGREAVRKLVVSAPTDEAMLRIINENRLTIIIDELHQSTKSFRDELVPFIKASRISAKKSTLVLIGTSAEPFSLVSSDPGIDRFVIDTPVASMGPDEARSLITDGFSKLGLEIDDSIVNVTVSSASGAPSILQALCLDMAEATMDDGRRRVSQADLISAVKHYVEDRHGRMTRKYMAAIETTGPKRYRKRILHAIAGLEGDYATMDDIRAAVVKELGTEVRSSDLSGPLRALKTAEYGSVLQDVDRETGGRIQNLNSFTDPMMKSYVRFMATITTTEIIHEDELRESLAADSSL